MTYLRIRRRLGAAFAVLALAAASGCSTVIKTSAGESAVDAAERLALVEAAAEISAAPWPKPSSSSLADRLSGERGEKISRKDALDAYLVRLDDDDNPEQAVLTDAARHLSAASALENAAQAACDAQSPRLSDVSLLEDAIGDLRETRSIYVSALKKLDVEDAQIDRLKGDFDKAIKDLGVAADQLAQSAMKKRARNFAGSEMRAPANLRAPAGGA
ncbi:MAG: hypothetical protein R3C42_00205 [Parvularculaceae bacterium]|nr:hypothetical protein [Parvularculaceae bacterium]